MEFTTDMMIESENGAKQSASLARMDLLPPSAIFTVGTILQQGAMKYGEENWRLIPTREHLNHAIIHVFAYLAGDKAEHHLGNAACRILMALEKSVEAK
ncbi:MAG: dATP/dGTP diphosphohydrolase domain-containing protein [Nostoc sp.]|uniref:dATP/dGTP diphosphohydrolase domain-containing protein n=1 Tax=Nostoc sp. TaxID=1180 RepID=UPI002FF781B3